MRSRLVASLSLAAVTAAWGAIPLIVRSVDVPSTQLVALRVWLAAVALLALGAASGTLRRARGHELRLVTAGVILAAHWAAFFWAINATTVAVALVLAYLAPVMLAVLAPLVLGEPPRALSSAALLLALVGAVIVARPGGGATGSGVVAGLITAATFAALVLVTKPAAVALGGLRVAAAELSVAAVVMAPWAVAALPAASGHWWQLVLLGVLLTGIGWIVYWRSVAVLPVVAVGVLSYVEPASAVVWASWVLEERPDPATWLGVVLVIAAGGLAAWDAARHPVAGA